MKIGFFCESPADRAAMAVFAEGILGTPPESISIDLEARSLPAYFEALRGVFLGVHFNSDAEGLVFIVDCDRTQPHDTAHDADTCRFCKIQDVIENTRKHLKPRVGRPELKVAIGLAVPTVEAWYLVGKNHAVGEAAWKVSPHLDSKQLKKMVYGTDRPSLELETDLAVKDARRVIEKHLKDIESSFPIGFGLMAQEIRSWKVPKS
jgi:hypothetical protein